MSADSSVDLIIAGGGLAGLLTGVLTARAGLAVQICERATNVRDDARSIALSESTRRVLETAGLWQAIADRAVPVAHIDVSQKNCFGSIRLHAEDEGLEAFGFVIRAGDLQTVLRTQAEQLCDLRTHTTVSRAVAQSNAIDVVCTRDGDEQHLSARLLVVADGRDSALRAGLGIAIEEHDREAAALVASVSVSGAEHDWAFERFTPTGPAALLPNPAGGHTVVWAQPRGVCQAMAASDRLADELARAFGPRIGAVQEVGQPAVFDLIFRRAHERTAERCVLIGDAAASFHPVAAQGFNLVVRDAAWLAEHCAQAQADSGDCGAEQMLADYACARATDTARVAWFTDLLDIGFRGRSPLLRAARGAALLGLDCLPRVRTAFVRFALGVDLPQSALARGVRHG